MKTQKAYAFIGDLIGNKNESIEIFSDYFLRRATKEQINIFKQRIDAYCRAVSCFEENRYEFAAKGTKNNYILWPLAEDKWNYWVVEHPDMRLCSNAKLAMWLSDIKLNPILEAVPNQVKEKPSYGLLQDDLVALIFLVENQYNFEPKNITNGDIKELSELYDLLMKFPKGVHKYDFIESLLTVFRTLKQVSSKSPLIIITIFSILEAILTHNPRRGETINGQLQSKLKLLNRRFTKAIDFHLFFKGPDTLREEKIIEKLYDYRSNIAHGDVIDFKDSLQVLVDHKTVYNFLDLLVRRVIVQALKEPQLIVDLKEC